jgi:hypothetical protein
VVLGSEESWFKIGSTVLAMVGLQPVSQDAENIFWGGITATATRLLCWFSGAGQGSITAASLKLPCLLWLLDKLMVF